MTDVARVLNGGMADRFDLDHEGSVLDPAPQDTRDRELRRSAGLIFLRYPHLWNRRDVQEVFLIGSLAKCEPVEILTSPSPEPYYFYYSSSRHLISLIEHDLVEFVVHDPLPLGAGCSADPGRAAVEAAIDAGLEECREQGVEIPEDLIKTARAMLHQAQMAYPRNYCVYPLDESALAVETQDRERNSVLMLFEKSGQIVCLSNIDDKSTRFRAESADAEPKALDIWMDALSRLGPDAS